MKRTIILLLTLILAVGTPYAQRKNNNVAAPPAKQQAAPKKTTPKKAPAPKKPQTHKQQSQKPQTQSSRPQTSKQEQAAQPQQTAPPQTANTIAGHEYVDLGLPSGLKWATCNVGASRPEDYGSYFAWGETSTKSKYDESNCPTYGKSESWLRSNGYIDYSGNLTPSHDAARANWGSTWRMPTKAEIEELIENTTTTWTTRNGVKGRLVTSKHNGKSIFLPAAGCRLGTLLDYEVHYGYYWSSTPLESNNFYAYYLYFSSGGFDRGWGYRDDGQSVRPVSE